MTGRPGHWSERGEYSILFLGSILVISSQDSSALGYREFTPEGPMTINPFAAREGTSAPQWPDVKKKLSSPRSVQWLLRPVIPGTLKWETDLYTPQVLGGPKTALFDNSAPAGYKILCHKDPELYTQLAVNCQKGQHLPSPEVSAKMAVTSIGGPKNSQNL